MCVRQLFQLFGYVIGPRSTADHIIFVLLLTVQLGVIAVLVWNVADFAHHGNGTVAKVVFLVTANPLLCIANLCGWLYMRARILTSNTVLAALTHRFTHGWSVHRKLLGWCVFFYMMLTVAAVAEVFGQANPLFPTALAKAGTFLHHIFLLNSITMVAVFVVTCKFVTEKVQLFVSDIGQIPFSDCVRSFNMRAKLIRDTSRVFNPLVALFNIVSAVLLFDDVMGFLFETEELTFVFFALVVFVWFVFSLNLIGARISQRSAHILEHISSPTTMIKYAQSNPNYSIFIMHIQTLHACNYHGLSLFGFPLSVQFVVRLLYAVGAAVIFALRYGFVEG